MKSAGIGRRAFFAHCVASLGSTFVGVPAACVASTSTWDKSISDREKALKDAVVKLESYGYRVHVTIHNGPDSQMDSSHAYRDVGNPIVSGIAGGNVALPIARSANRKEEELTKVKGPDYFEGEPHAQPIPRRYFMAAIASGALVGVPIGYGTEALKIPTPDEQKEIDKLVKMLTDSGYKVVHPRAFGNRQIASVVASATTATVTYVASRALSSQKLIDRLDEQEQANKVAGARRDAIKRAVYGNNRNN